VALFSPRCTTLFVEFVKAQSLILFVNEEKIIDLDLVLEDLVNDASGTYKVNAMLFNIQDNIF